MYISFTRWKNTHRKKYRIETLSTSGPEAYYKRKCTGNTTLKLISFDFIRGVFHLGEIGTGMPWHIRSIWNCGSEKISNQQALMHSIWTPTLFIFSNILFEGGLICKIFLRVGAYSRGSLIRKKAIAKHNGRCFLLKEINENYL